MKLFVHVKPNSDRVVVEEIDATHFNVEVTAPPIKNKANEAVIAAIANFLGLPKSTIHIKRGANAKYKTIEINSTEKLF